MNNIKYTFSNINNINDEFLPKDLDNIIYFYQICTFPNHRTKKFNMKKYVIEGKQFLKIDEYNLTKRQCKKFYKVKKPNEYKCYATYDLRDIDPPSMGDILMARSEILADNYNYSGFAPFSKL